DHQMSCINDGTVANRAGPTAVLFPVGFDHGNRQLMFPGQLLRQSIRSFCAARDDVGRQPRLKHALQAVVFSKVARTNNGDFALDELQEHVYWGESLRCIGYKLCHLSVHSPQRFSPCDIPAGIVGWLSVSSQRWYPASFPASVYLLGVVQTHGVNTTAT